MKTCKDCGAEVSNSAKTCPKCGARLKMGAGKIILIVIGVLVVIGVISGIAGGGDEGSDSSSASSSAASTSKTTETATDAHAGDAAYEASNKKFETVEEATMEQNLGYPQISGALKNISGKSFSYAQIEIILYDADGAQIGSAIDNITNLEQDSVWKYSATGFEEGAESFKIAEITAY